MVPPSFPRELVGTRAVELNGYEDGKRQGDDDDSADRCGPVADHPGAWHRRCGCQAGPWQKGRRLGGHRADGAWLRFRLGV